MRSRAVMVFASLILVALAAGRPGSAGRWFVAEGGLSLSEADCAAFSGRFAREVWPLLAEPAEAEKGCLACHGDDEANTSPLVFSGDPAGDFKTLLAEGYFDRANPVSILAKVAHKRPEKRMPPEPAQAWSPDEVDVLRSFVKALDARRSRTRPG
jgi:hypothetical protein